MKKILVSLFLTIIIAFPWYTFAAISATHILTAASASGLNSYTTASGSPGTNKLELLLVGSQVSSGTVNTPTVTGAGLTWVQVATQISSDNFRRATLFRAMGTGSAGALTIDLAGQTQVRAGWSWSEFDGVDTTGTNGSGAIVQSATTLWNTSDGAKTSITVTLGAFSDVNNATYGAIRFNTNSGGVLTVGSGFTELGNAISNVRYESMYQLANDTTVDWSYPSESTFTQAIAVEIKVASAASPTVSNTPTARVEGAVNLNGSLSL